MFCRSGCIKNKSVYDIVSKGEENKKHNEDSLTTDAVFKIFFHKRKDYLVLVINEVLKLNVKESDITFSNNEDILKEQHIIIRS